MACGILVPPPGIELMPLAVKARSPNHWMATEVPTTGWPRNSPGPVLISHHPAVFFFLINILPHLLSHSLHMVMIFKKYLVIYLFRLCQVLVAACELLVEARTWYLVPQPGIEPGSPALGVWSLTHWITREVPSCSLRLNHKCNPYQPPLMCHNAKQIQLQ